MLRASAQQPSLSAPLVYETGPKKETNADSLSAQATLNSDTDRSSKRTCSKIDEVQQVVWIQDTGTDRRDTQECYSIKSEMSEVLTGPVLLVSD